MKRGTLIIKVLFVCLWVASILSCRGPAPPVQFFALGSAFPENGAREDFSKTKDLAIGLGPLVLPKYLDRSQIVTRIGPHRLEVNEFHRWAGTIESDFLRVLTENISFLTGTDNIELYPYRGDFQPDWSVKINVFAFEGTPGGPVRLDCVWALSGPGRKGDIPPVSTSIVEQAGPTFDDLVSAESRAIAKLAKEIVNKLRERL